MNHKKRWYRDEYVILAITVVSTAISAYVVGNLLKSSYQLVTQLLPAITLEESDLQNGTILTQQLRVFNSGDATDTDIRINVDKLPFPIKAFGDNAIEPAIERKGGVGKNFIIRKYERLKEKNDITWTFLFVKDKPVATPPITRDNIRVIGNYTPDPIPYEDILPEGVPIVAMSPIVGGILFFLTVVSFVLNIIFAFNIHRLRTEKTSPQGDGSTPVSVENLTDAKNKGGASL